MKTLRFAKTEVETMLSHLATEAKIMLVGDHGVYIMGHAEKKNHLVYADTCNPDKDEDFYDNKRDLFGGDDGVDEIGNADSLRAIVAAARKWVLIKLYKTKLEVTHD